jgi:UrcA family protein
MFIPEIASASSHPSRPNSVPATYITFRGQKQAAHQLKLKGNLPMSYIPLMLPASLALCASLALASAASAQDRAYGEPEPAAIRIAYSDSDLHTANGAKRLAFRVRLAAAKVCGGDNVLVHMDGGFARCQAAAINRAVGKLNAPLVKEALGIQPIALADR